MTLLCEFCAGAKGGDGEEIELHGHIMCEPCYRIVMDIIDNVLAGGTKEVLDQLHEAFDRLNLIQRAMRKQGLS